MSALLPSDSALGGSPTETPMDVFIDKAEREAESDGYLALDDVRWLIAELRAAREQNAALNAELLKMRHWAADASTQLVGQPNGAHIGRARTNINKVYKRLLALCGGAVASSSQETPNG